MRVVFMGTPAFAVPTLSALQESGHEVVAVYTQPPRPAGRGQKETPSPVHRFALEHNIPVCTPASLKTPEAQAQFAEHKARVAVVVAYGLLLPKPILTAFPLGCINVHPSLLPRWRGAAPIQRTIMAGDEVTGICIMQMDEGLDTGNVLLKEEGIPTSGLDAGALHDMLAAKAAPLVIKVLDEIQSLTPQKQPEVGVTYAKKITKEECKINWAQSAQHIHNQIRGLSPAPGAYFTYNGENIKIFSSGFSATEQFKNMAVGTVIDEYLTVECGEGALTIEEIQRPGKKRMSTGEMLKSYPIPAGIVLE
jgi:methionyl-tRNA formyltransferase